jgi:hypothetical protein
MSNLPNCVQHFKAATGLERHEPKWGVRVEVRRGVDQLAATESFVDLEIESESKTQIRSSNTSVSAPPLFRAPENRRRRARPLSW